MFGIIAKSMRDNGNTIKWMDLERLFGWMVVLMKDAI